MIDILLWLCFAHKVSMVLDTLIVLALLAWLFAFGPMDKDEEKGNELGSRLGHP